MAHSNDTWSIAEVVETDNSSVTSPPAASIPALASAMLHYKIANELHRYWIPFTVCIGLFGNTASFLIMLKPHNRRIGCCNYTAALAIADNFILLTALDYWTLSFKARPMHNIECKTMVWLFQAAAFSAMVFIFSMTVDRLLAVRYPFRARVLCSPRRARIAIACISVTSLVYTLPYLFTSGLILSARTCVGVLTKDTLSSIYNWVNIFLGSIVPFFGLLTMNALIIFTSRNRNKYFSKDNTSQETTSTSMRQTTDNRSQDGGQENPAFQNEQQSGIQQQSDSPCTSISHVIASVHLNHNTEDERKDKPEPENTEHAASSNTATSSIKTAATRSFSDIRNASNKSKSSQRKRGARAGGAEGVGGSRERQLTLMLLLVTFTFLLLTLPQYVRYLAAVVWNYTATPEDYADYILLAHVTNKVFYVNNACNFFLYCISGRKFRKDFRDLFKRNK